MIGSGVLGVVGFRRASSWSAAGLLPAAGLAFGAAFGLPRWILSLSQEAPARRSSSSISRTRSTSSCAASRPGLPLLDSMKVIVNDAPEPIKSEFRAILETQTIGIPLGEACGKLFERVPLPEANFFGIVISIQQKAGGNLSEALGNLSRVLRDRKKMKAKIKAMSMEAKASAGIIGSLPILVMGIVYITSPDYIDAAVDDAARPPDAGRLRLLDVRRHHVDEKNDQLRFLTMLGSAHRQAARPALPGDDLRRDRGDRHRRDARACRCSPATRSTSG